MTSLMECEHCHEWFEGERYRSPAYCCEAHRTAHHRAKREAEKRASALHIVGQITGLTSFRSADGELASARLNILPGAALYLAVEAFGYHWNHRGLWESDRTSISLWHCTDCGQWFFGPSPPDSCDYCGRPTHFAHGLSLDDQV